MGLPSLPAPSQGALGWAAALLAGGMSALAFAFALSHADTLMVLVAYLAPAPLLAAGLGAGVVAGLVASVVGTAGLVLFGQDSMALFYVVIYALPAAVLAALALRSRLGHDGQVYWYPEGYIVTALALYAGALFILVATLVARHEGGLLALSTQVLTELAQRLEASIPPEEKGSLPPLADMIPHAARTLPAMLGGAWILVMVFSGLAAQSSLRQQNWHLRTTGFRWSGLVVPRWLILVTAAMGIVGFVAADPYGYIATNTCAILCLPFLFVGLAVVHALAGRQKTPWVWLAAFYIVLGVFIWPVLFVVLLGVVDQLRPFRREQELVPR